MNNINRIAKNTAPLCYLPSGDILCYQYGNVLVFHNENIVRRIPIIRSFAERFLGRSRYLFRLLRLGVRAAYAIDENNVVLSIGDYLYELDLVTNKLSSGFICKEHTRPLIFTKVENISTVESGLYFGEYLGNRKKNPVSIYKRESKDKWCIVYTFPKGAINHIHNIVCDPYRDCLWIFTGDFDEAAAIWKITDNFQKVECLVRNNQRYRGCVAFALPECVLYATDAPYADNFVYSLDPQTMETTEVISIAGSCIYGCRWQNRYVFSSTVEGDGRNVSLWELLCGRTKGAGIKDWYTHLYIGNLHEGFKDIYREEKDIMPFYTFQFGTFKFPYGINNTEVLYFQPIATCKNDLSLLKFTI